MKQAASDLGMTEQSLHKLIKANSTKIDTLLAIADYFNVEPAYFFESQSTDTNQYIKVNKEEFTGHIKKVLPYSIHGIGLIKLQWNEKEQKFDTYFDILDKQYTPTSEDLKYISSLLETKIKITDETTPKDISKLLMTKHKFDFTSTYYYNIKKMQAQEALQKFSTFIEKHHIQKTPSIEKDIEEMKDKIRYYQSKSIIGGNRYLE